MRRRRCFRDKVATVAASLSLFAGFLFSSRPIDAAVGQKGALSTNLRSIFAGSRDSNPASSLLHHDALGVALPPHFLIYIQSDSLSFWII